MIPGVMYREEIAFLRVLVEQHICTLNPVRFWDMVAAGRLLELFDYLEPKSPSMRTKEGTA